jgi:hypothetical protein
MAKKQITKKVLTTPKVVKQTKEEKNMQTTEALITKIRAEVRKEYDNKLAIFCNRLLTKLDVTLSITDPWFADPRYECSINDYRDLVEVIKDFRELGLDQVKD